jgi:hypothetical protein
VKIGKSVSETSAPLTLAYGEYVMKKSSVFEWHRWFKEGQEDVQDKPRSGQPKTQRTHTNVDSVRTLEHSVLEVPTRLQESVRRKEPKLWPDKWILHIDKDPVHDVLRACEFLAKNSIKNRPSTSFNWLRINIFGSFKNLKKKKILKG